jgi:hypothetical protein
MKASKFVFNNNHYTAVSGLAQLGILVPSNKLLKRAYYFGLEEWMNNPILKELKLGYIDSFRRTLRTGVEERVVLFMYNPNDNQIYYVGNLYGVEQLNEQEINQIRINLNNENWLEIVQTDFNNIGDQRLIQNHKEYMKCWHAQLIVGPTGGSFIVNIKYKKLEIFSEKERVNITKLIPEVNNSWKKLSILYNVPESWKKCFKK